jgi:hypothetical protein
MQCEEIVDEQSLNNDQILKSMRKKFTTNNVRSAVNVNCH